MVLDSAGIGEMPDAAAWGDAGADTLGHILSTRKVALPNLQRLGLGNIRPLAGLPPVTGRPVHSGNARSNRTGKIRRPDIGKWQGSF